MKLKKNPGSKHNNRSRELDEEWLKKLTETDKARAWSDAHTVSNH